MGGSASLSETATEKTKPQGLTADRIAKAVRRELHDLILELYPAEEVQEQDEKTEPFDRPVFVGPPAPGADALYRVIWPTYPLSVFCRVTTDGTAGSRSVAVEYRTGNGERYLVAGSAVTLAPSQQEDFCWHPAAGTPTWPVAAAAIAALPQQWLYSPSIIAVTVSGGSTGDQIDNVRLALRY